MSPPTRQRAGIKKLIALLDDPVELTVARWRQRNVQLYDELAERGLIDPMIVSRSAHVFLTETLIHEDNPAAVDPQNAGHIRAQNENILHYALKTGAPSQTLTIALIAGFIHDLNKSVGDGLRQDRFAVRNAGGERVGEQTTVAMSVGLNHLGARTQRALREATRLEDQPLTRAIAASIDQCIVHHGLGSSMFIQRLVDGDNEWWGDEYVDSKGGRRKLIHPAQPKLTFQSVLHDVADSTQQMQGGVAWLQKYPYGFWTDSGRSLWAMLSGGADDEEGVIPLSLRRQIEVETETCRQIVLAGHESGLFDDEAARRLEAAIVTVTRPSREWIDDDAEHLARLDGTSVYHDVARARGIAPEAAVELLHRTVEESAELETLLQASARAVDVRRARELAELIVTTARGV